MKKVKIGKYFMKKVMSENFMKNSHVGKFHEKSHSRKMCHEKSHELKNFMKNSHVEKFHEKSQNIVCRKVS